MSTPGIEPGPSQMLLTLVPKRVAIAQLEKHKRSDNKVMGHARYARIGGGHHGRRRGVASSSSQAGARLPLPSSSSFLPLPSYDNHLTVQQMQQH